MYSLLHCHFESALRALAVHKSGTLGEVRAVASSSAFSLISPAERLLMLWRTVKHTAASEPDMFTVETFHRVADAFVEEMVADQVEHVDVRIGTSLRRWRDLRGAVDAIAILRKAVARSGAELSVSFVAGLDFTKPLAEVERVVTGLAEGIDPAAELFAGVDVNLLPADLAKFDRLLPVLRQLRADGWKINVHLGELFDNDVSRYVLKRLVPDRIGHGVLLLDDPEVIAVLREHDVCLDMCPVSNTVLNVIDWASSSPAKRALDLGLPVTINTDDPALFGTTLRANLALSGLTAAELELVVDTGRKHRYGPR
ncbi:hypothetical protein [Saccharopolyspora sp. 6M]|uniref:hypothetical protein n=1 Tax=Saccharopolyspora sp. 6M TaxID=2877237 RepID=UPI001CD81B0F|nr:hypothetical protein [Saccharopolyspora sp. 6M]MCA1229396.1 hypothetical protein [Saccharopolyspora sp. 6M]